MPDLSYASAAASAARKRKMAEMLQQQAFKPNEVGLIPGAKMSLANPLAALLQGYASNKLEKEAAEEESSAATRQQEGIAKLLQEIPKGTEEVPAQPIEQEAVGGPPPAAQEAAAAAPPLTAAFGAGGMPNIGPRDNELTGSAPPATAEMAKLLGGPAPAPDLAGLAPPPEGGPSVPPGGTDGPPLLPSLPTKMDMSIPGAEPKKFTDAIPGKEVTPEEWMQYGGKFLPLGPEAAKFGNTFQEKAMSQLMEPGTKRYIVAGNGDILDTKTNQYLSGGPMTKAKQAEVAGARQDKMQLEYDKLDAKIANDTATADERRRWHDMAEGLRRIGANKGDGEHSLQLTTKTDAAGNTYSYDKKKDVFIRAGSGGKIIHDPAKDGPLLSIGDVKATDAAAEQQSKISLARTTADAIDADAKEHGKNNAFSGPNKAKNAINSATSGWMFDPSKRLTAAQQELYAAPGRLFSVELHELYGTALTTGERETARTFDITPGMDAKTRATRLRQQADFREKMMVKYGDKIRGAAAQRGGGAPAGAAPAASPGWGTMTTR